MPGQDPTETNYVSDIDPATWDSCDNTGYVADTFSIIELDYTDRPYAGLSLLSDDIVTRERILDEDNVPRVEMDGELIYFPTNMIQYALGLLDDQVISGTNKSALTTVESIAAKLVEMSLRSETDILFPYNLDFPLHGSRSGETMVRPWYSAMAQGQALTLFCRLHTVTGKTSYLEICHKIGESFKRIKGSGRSPWISCIDKNGNLWLEEYPCDLPCFTLNGKIFAIFGLYDYFLLTHDPHVAHLLRAAITTIKVNIERFRAPGGYSYYCLKHKFCHVQYPEYHDVHVEQLEFLHAITRDDYFAEMATAFRDDTPTK